MELPDSNCIDNQGGIVSIQDENTYYFKLLEVIDIDMNIGDERNSNVKLVLTHDNDMRLDD
jgi:hypothetical protein